MTRPKKNANEAEEPEVVEAETVDAKAAHSLVEPAVEAGEKPETAEKPQADDKYITVRSKLKQQEDGGNPVALYEQDPRHPKGEVFIAGKTPVRVAETSAVLKAISDGKLEKV